MGFKIFLTFCSLILLYLAYLLIINGYKGLRYKKMKTIRKSGFGNAEGKPALFFGSIYIVLGLFSVICALTILFFHVFLSYSTV